MVKYFFFVFLFFLPLQTVYLLREVFIDGSKWQYGTVGVYFSDVLLIAALALFVVPGFVWKKFQISNFKFQMSSALLILFVLWVGLSIVWAPDQVLARYFFIKLLLTSGVFFLAQSLDDEDVKTVVWVLITAAVLQSLIGIGQFILQSTFASSLLGMSAHEVWQAGTSVLKNDTGRWLRAYGSFPHPNILGGFLAAILTASISYYVSCSTYLRRNLRVIFLSGLIIILLGLILTFSRVAWLGAGMGVVVYCVFRIKYHVWGKWDIRMLVTLGIAVVVFAGVLYETVFPRFDSTVIESEGSVSERVQSLEDAQVVIDEGNMLLGTGAGNFTAQIIRLQPDRSVWTIQPAHNVFVLILAELGLVGIVIFIGFFWALLYTMKANKNTIFVIAFVALIPSLFLDHYLWTSHFGLFFFFLFVGLSVRK